MGSFEEEGTQGTVEGLRFFGHVGLLEFMEAEE